MSNITECLFPMPAGSIEMHVLYIDSDAKSHSRHCLPPESNIVSKLRLHFPVLYPTHSLPLDAHFSEVLPISLLVCNIFPPYKPVKSSAHPEAIVSPLKVRCMATLSQKLYHPNPTLSQIQHFIPLKCCFLG